MIIPILVRWMKLHNASSLALMDTFISRNARVSVNPFIKDNGLRDDVLATWC